MRIKYQNLSPWVVSMQSVRIAYAIFEYSVLADRTDRAINHRTNREKRISK